MSAFDPKTFAQMTFNQANSTKVLPVPAGDQDGTIKEAKIDAWSSEEKGTAGLKCTILIDCDSPSVREATKREVNIVRHEFFLDLTPDGMLDFGEGMNVRLGRAREAAGLNTPGEPFGFDMFAGRRVRASVRHRINTQTGDPVAEATALTRIP